MVLAALTWGVGFVVRLHGTDVWARHRHGVAAYMGLFALFLVGAWLVAKLPARRAAMLILLGAMGLQIAAASAPSRTSDDLYRYVWDGRVQAAGIDPYRYVPADPALVSLRDPSLWPPAGVRTDWCVGPGTPGVVPGCTLINRPTVHTVYPPVAEGYFFVVHSVAGAAGAKGIQIAAAGVAVSITVLLLFGLRTLGRDPRYAVLWAWCPTVATEGGNGAHVDVVAILLTGFALILLARGRTGRGAALLGLAIATKVTPVLAVPGAMRRRPLVFLPALIGPIALVYLPHFLAVRSGVLGFFGGYLKEEGYDTGTRFTLLTHVVPASWAAPTAVATLAAAGIAVLWRANPAKPWRGGMVLTGAAMVVATPPFPWYGMLMVLFVAFEGWTAVPWLALVFGGFADRAQPGSGAWGYGIGAAVFVGAYAGIALTRAVRKGTAGRRTSSTNSATDAGLDPHPSQVLIPHRVGSACTSAPVSSCPLQPREQEPDLQGRGAGVDRTRPVWIPWVTPRWGIRTGTTAQPQHPSETTPSLEPRPPGGPPEARLSRLSGLRVEALRVEALRVGGSTVEALRVEGLRVEGSQSLKVEDPQGMRVEDPQNSRSDSPSAETSKPETKIDVILPCLNEEQALPYVLSRMPANYHPIVVDNGSTDASANLAAALGAQVVHEPRKGFGAACHAGLLAATADIVCFMDCDASFDPQDLPKVTRRILDGSAELSLGQRRPVTRNSWPPHARLANRLLARRIRRETGIALHDLGPMRAAFRQDLLDLEVEDRRFGYPLEMVLKAAAGNWRIEEVEVPYAPRAGKSKVTGTVGGTVKAIRDMRRVWKAATQ